MSENHLHPVERHSGNLETSQDRKTFEKRPATELVDAGERLSFYDDFLRGSTTAIVTPLSRAKTQICLGGEFVPKQGNISLLRSLWAQIGSFTNHQATYCDSDWMIGVKND